MLPPTSWARLKDKTCLSFIDTRARPETAPPAGVRKQGCVGRSGTRLRLWCHRLIGVVGPTVDQFMIIFHALLSSGSFFSPIRPQYCCDLLSRDDSSLSRSRQGVKREEKRSPRQRFDQSGAAACSCVRLSHFYWSKHTSSHVLHSVLVTFSFENLDVNKYVASSFVNLSQKYLILTLGR